MAGQHDKQVWQRPHLLPGQALEQVLVKVRQLEQGYRAFRGSLSSQDTGVKPDWGPAVTVLVSSTARAAVSRFQRGPEQSDTGVKPTRGPAACFHVV